MNSSSILKIKNSVDIYEIPSENNKVQLQFYKINTREKITLELDYKVSQVFAKIDGKLTIAEIFKELQLGYSISEAIELFNYLAEKGILVDQANSSVHNNQLSSRYCRQINYFDDLVSDMSGLEAQIKLSEKSVVVFGIGAVGASIAIHLVRSGVKNLTLIDFKDLTKNNMQCHLYAMTKDIGNSKTQVLKRHLLRIDPECRIQCINKKLLPLSDVWDFVPIDSDVVINTADEPYIGHTTLKLGRALWPRNIALYIAGGFDAHSMSTGEFVVKGMTPCVDCCSNTFKEALKGWKPTYPQVSHLSKSVNKNSSEPKSLSSVPLISGGAGSVAAQSLFSASYGSINIINYLIGNFQSKEKFSERGEYLINQGKMTWVELNSQKECPVCVCG